MRLLCAVDRSLQLFHLRFETINVTHLFLNNLSLGDLVVYKREQLSKNVSARGHAKLHQFRAPATRLAQLGALRGLHTALMHIEQLSALCQLHTPPEQLKLLSNSRH